MLRYFLSNLSLLFLHNSLRRCSWPLAATVLPIGRTLFWTSPRNKEYAGVSSKWDHRPLLNSKPDHLYKMNICHLQCILCQMCTSAHIWRVTLFYHDLDIIQEGLGPLTPEDFQMNLLWNNYYHPCMGVGNNFSWVCLTMCLSVYL